MPSEQPQTLPPGGVDALAGERYCAALTEARDRTLALVEPLADDDLDRVHDPLMSPLVWDLGHIAAFEELWLCRHAGGLEPLRPELSQVYDASETPRRARGEIPYLRRDDALEYMSDVRARALAVLARVDLSSAGGPLNAGGFVWEMVVAHEHQHDETMLQTLQLAEQGTFAPPASRLPEAPLLDGSPTVAIEAGAFAMGDPGDGFAYDNERPRHELQLPAFEIDRTSVTNGCYREFVDDGGYERPELWSTDGWSWRAAERVERPLYWTADGRERRFERCEALDPTLPVMHVCFYEADAFARWRGARLPTEAEWEKAAAWDPATGGSRRQPWGDAEASPERANLDQLGFGPTPAGSLPAGRSASGVLGLIGDAWEWTASRFEGYPGFRPFPYREYSQVFFGADHRVLRGGSWATRPSVARASVRNWDHPQRRQIFAGFRCATGGR